MNIKKYKLGFPALKFENNIEGVLEIIFATDNPVNAMSPEMHRDVAYIWRDIDLDNTIQSVLVRSTGKAFSAGGDFTLINKVIENDNALMTVWKESKDLVYNMINCSKPIISAINGPAVGAGLAIALLADISIAAKDARIIDNHTKLGVTTGDFSVIILPLLCGMAKAKYILLTGKSVSGEEAEHIGLVSLCVENEELYEIALNTANEIAKSSSSAVRWTKHSLNNWLRMMGSSFDQSLALEILGFRLPDIKEGLSAMREKRPANFENDCSL